MSEPITSRVPSFDDIELAVHRQGSGRAVLLLHGLFSDASMNWLKWGTADALAGAGFEAIMPDLRAHGDSAKPHDPEAYPADVLAKDTAALVEALDLADYDLVGFSLGARTAAAAVAAGLAPRRLVLAGMGLEGVTGWARRSAFFIDAIDRFDAVEPGDPAFHAVSFMRSQGVDRAAARHLLGSVSDLSEGDLARITAPTLVLCGEDDRDNGSPETLADALPNARHRAIPGTHMSSVTKPEFGRAIVDFLT